MVFVMKKKPASEVVSKGLFSRKAEKKVSIEGPEETVEEKGAPKKSGSQLSNWFVAPSAASEKFAEQRARAEAQKASRRRMFFAPKDGEDKEFWMRNAEPLFVARLHSIYDGKSTTFHVCMAESGSCALCDAGSYAPWYAVYEFIDLQGYKSKQTGKSSKNYSCYYIANDKRKTSLDKALRSVSNVSKVKMEITRVGTKGDTTHIFSVKESNFVAPLEAKQAEDLSKLWQRDWKPDPEVLEQFADIYRRMNANSSVVED